MREKLTIAIDTITGFFVFALLTTAFHEYIHANITRELGGVARVVFSWTSGYAVIESIPSGAALVIVALSGGLLTALLFFYFDRWWLEDPSDINLRQPCRFFMFGQLFYGIGEGLYVVHALPFSLITWAAITQIAALFVVVGLLYKNREVKKWTH